MYPQPWRIQLPCMAVCKVLIDSIYMSMASDLHDKFNIRWECQHQPTKSQWNTISTLLSFAKPIPEDPEDISDVLKHTDTCSYSYRSSRVVLSTGLMFFAPPSPIVCSAAKSFSVSSTRFKWKMLHSMWHEKPCGKRRTSRKLCTGNAQELLPQRQ